VSVQFGRWNIDGLPVDKNYLPKAGEMMAPYGPDGGDAYIKDNVGILYLAFHTTKESRKETQPFVTPSGTVFCWDGRLDNREDLARELCEKVAADASDMEIMAAAYQAWGTRCFARLIGDWALSLWDPRNQALILAKDPIGTRHLYYSFDQMRITWSTILDPLVLLEGKMFALEEEYIAGWLSFFPATHLTPYVGVHAVPPSCFVQLEPGRHTCRKYWDFDLFKRVRYGTDLEYEEHFRSVFAKAVQRRLRSDVPVLAELSGGRDSSSVVCMADTLIACGAAQTPRLDTLSCYDDSEPNWNERPYFTKVEEKRGRTGIHIDVGLALRSDLDLNASPVNHHFMAIPNNGRRISQRIIEGQGLQVYRVVLSGTGGDEVMGGVPAAMPELQDLIARARFRALARQLKLWALQKRKPWFHLLLEAIQGFLPPTLMRAAKTMHPAPWLQSNFVKRNAAALTGYPSRMKAFGPSPSCQGNTQTVNGLRRQLACASLPFEPLYEKRYPYLDRSLLEFMFAVPPEQLVRPSQRRSLMRRALVGIVPDEILNKRGKAVLTRAPRLAISREWTSLTHMTEHMLSSLAGIVDSERFLAALQKARRGEHVATITLARTISIEIWLRDIRARGVVNLGARVKPEFGLQAALQD